MNFFRKFHCSLNCSRPESFVASEWQSNKFKPNVKYLIYRWIVAIYFNFVVVLSLKTSNGCNQLEVYPIYLTNWNVVINGFSSLLAAVLVTLYYRNSFAFNHDLQKNLDACYMKLRLPLKIFWVFSTWSTVLSVSLLCVYWPFITTGRNAGLNDTLTHAGNAIVNFIDLFIYAYPAYYGHVVYVFTGSVFYVLFSVVFTLAGGTDRDGYNYIYPVLDWKNNTKGAILFATFTTFFLSTMHLILTALIKLKIYIHKWCKEKSKKEKVPVDNLGFKE